MCMVGGTVSTLAFRQEFKDTFGVSLMETYGSTETCGPITMAPPTPAGSAERAGLPIPGLEVRLQDPVTGSEVPVGEEGEVVVSGPSVMLGYYHEPEATAAAIRGGWYHTGDMARRDEHGHITITGRVKDLIIRGGENISPGEVEEILLQQVGVLDAAIVGKPHDDLDETPIAFVVPGPDGLDADQVLPPAEKSCRHSRFPRNSTKPPTYLAPPRGKIMRHRLAELPARLRAIRGNHFETLARPEWVSVRAEAVCAVAGRWCVAGADATGLAALLRAEGAVVESCPDLASARAAIRPDVPRPDTTVTFLGSPHRDCSGSTHLGDRAALDSAIEQVNAWLNDDVSASSQLVIVTNHAVVTSPTEESYELDKAAVWGTALRNPAAPRRPANSHRY